MLVSSPPDDLCIDIWNRDDKEIGYSNVLGGTHPGGDGNPRLWTEFLRDFEARVGLGPEEWRRRDMQSLGSTCGCHKT